MGLTMVERKAVLWQTATLARSLIEVTLSRFEKGHQPKVVARASALFRDMREAAASRSLSIRRSFGRPFLRRRALTW